VQLLDADGGLCAIGRKLHRGFDVSAPRTSQVMPNPTPVNKLDRRTVPKWLDAIKNVGLFVRQFFRKGISLDSR